MSQSNQPPNKPPTQVFKFEPQKLKRGEGAFSMIEYKNEVIQSQQQIYADPAVQVFSAVVGGILFLIVYEFATRGGRTMKKRSNKRHNKTYKQKR